MNKLLNVAVQWGNLLTSLFLESLPLKSYWRGASRAKQSSDAELQHYYIPEACTTKDCKSFLCGRCYKNGERLFCTLHYSPASPVLGQSVSCL